ncbi:hypothetical protein Hypma_014132 [Hypsizygus marmoreus]|uniref:Uncharacterized protein n=1 Tax=Hypsizygus marmoreus TaxID=39966 RepID=A0A369KAX4_HYPMA|nr:hypothetical protein Hypma_014132 [Hypsizygus marmoreus]
MSKATSPWSMIGRFMGNPHLRSSSRKRKEENYEQSIHSVQGKGQHESIIAQAAKVEDPAEEVAKETLEGKNTPNTGPSLRAGQETSRPTTPGEEEQEWTQVVEHLDPSLASRAGSAEPANDATTGTEEHSLREVVETESTSDHKNQVVKDDGQQFAEPGRKEVGILAVDTGDADLERRLKEISQELALADEQNQQLKQEHKRQVERIRTLEDDVRSLADNKVAMITTVEDMKREADFTLTRVQQLEADATARSDTILMLERTLETAGREKSEVLNQLHDAENHARELEGQNTTLLQTDEERENKIRRIQENNIETTTKLNTAAAELITAIRQREAVQDQNRQLVDKLHEKEKALKDLEANSHMSQDEASQHRLESLQHQNRMLTDQIRRQSEQLRPPPLAQSGQASRWERSIQEYTEIVGPFDRLNSEIFQIAASMVESLDFGEGKDWAAQEMRGVVERATLLIGRPMILAMQAMSHQNIADVNPLVIQIALQVCMAKSCAKIIASWYPGHWEYGNFLEAIYARIRGTEGKYAEKWRTITQAQLRRTSDPYVQSEMKAFLLDNLVDILAIAGCGEAVSATKQELVRFQERVELIVKLALALNMSMGDEWEMFVVQPNDLFDPETMDNAYEGDKKTQSEDLVVGTTDIGLKKSSRGIVLKPKVAVHWMIRGNHVRFVRVE